MRINATIFSIQINTIIVYYSYCALSYVCLFRHFLWHLILLHSDTINSLETGTFNTTILNSFDINESWQQSQDLDNLCIVVKKERMTINEIDS